MNKLLLLHFCLLTLILQSCAMLTVTVSDERNPHRW